jgi:hypothetical protein
MTPKPRHVRLATPQLKLHDLLVFPEGPGCPHLRPRLPSRATPKVSSCHRTCCQRPKGSPWPMLSEKSTRKRHSHLADACISCNLKVDPYRQR